MKSSIISTTANAISSGGTISGDVTISGDLTVQGGGSLTYDEILTGTMSITTTDTSDNLTLISTDDGASAAPNLRLYRNSPNPADSDIFGQIDFDGRNDNSQDFVGARIKVASGDVSDGSEAAQIEFDVMTAGTLREYMRMASGSTPAVIFNQDSQDIDFRVLSDNLDPAFFVQGSDGMVGIGNTPDVNFHIKLADTANARIEDTSSDGIAKLDFKNDARQATIGVYGDDSDNFKIDHGGGAVLTINTAQQVGIGVTPTTPLHVKVNTSTTDTTNGLLIEQDGTGDAVAQFLLTDTKRYMMGIDNSDSDNFVINTGAGDLSSGNRVTFNSDMDATFPSKVGIGTTSPDANLELEKDGADQELRLSCHSDTEAHTSSLTFFKSDGTAASPATIDVGAVLGQVIFNGYDDNSYDTGSKIVAMADANWSSTERGTKLSFYTRDANESLSENLSINADGSSTFAGDVKISTNDNVYLSLDSTQTNGDEWQIFNANSGSTSTLQFKNIDQSKVPILLDEDARVSINNTSPSPVHTDYSTLQIGGQGFILSATTAGADKSLYIGNNAFKHTDGTWDTIANDESMLYEQHGGKHYFYIAPAHASVSSLATKFVIDTNSRISLSNNGGEATNTIFGYQAGNTIHSSSGMNTFVGHQVADTSNDADADENTAVGHLALSGLTSGAKNVAIGSYTGINITSGDENVLIGRSAGNNHNSSDLVAIGTATLASISDAAADGTVAVGYNALTALTSGALNTVLGYKAGGALTTGASNVFIGHQSGQTTNTDSTANVAIGRQSFAGTHTGSCVSNIAIGNLAMGAGACNGANNNVAVGDSALEDITSGDSNTAIGTSALTAITTSSNNTAVGHNALTSCGDSYSNVAVGKDAGDTITNSGAFNVCIGTSADVSAGTAENQIAIGYGVTTQGNNTVTLGNSSVTDVYLGHVGKTAIGHVMQLEVGEGGTSFDVSSKQNNWLNVGGNITTSNHYYGIIQDTNLVVQNGSAKTLAGFLNTLYWNHATPFGAVTGISQNINISTVGSAQSGDVKGMDTTINVTDTDVDSGNIYGLKTYLHLDAGVVSNSVYGTHTDVDIDGGTYEDYIFGDYLTINTTQNPSSSIRARQINLGGAGVDATNDIFWYLYDSQNSDVVAQVTALEGVATFDSGDFAGAPDYAEYFESKDGKPIAIGSTVKLDGDKIVACSDGDTPMGVVRPKSSSAIVANCATTGYQGKYLKTDYDEIILEDYKITEWEEEITFEEYNKRNKDDTGGVLGGTVKDFEVGEGDSSKYYRKHSYHSDRLPSGIKVPSDAVELTPSHQRKKLNPDYDPSKTYKNRKERDEWCLIGLLGQIPITKGQPIASNWIKMKDVSDTVEMYFVK